MRNFQELQIKEKVKSKKNEKEENLKKEVNTLRESIATLNEENSKRKEEKRQKIILYKEILDKQLEDKKANKPKIMSDEEKKLNRDILARILARLGKQNEC